jgi:Holliday junction resolvase RusA-like endonuclease
MTVSLTILGPPRTKKNSPRVFKTRGGRRFVMPSAASVAWTEAAVLQLNRQWRGQPSLVGPVEVKASFYRARRTGDADNFMAALGDALQKARIIGNDRQIESWDGTRLLVDAVRPRVEVEVRVMT